VLRQKICFATWNRRTWQVVNTASSADRHRYGQINRSIIDTILRKDFNAFESESILVIKGYKGKHYYDSYNNPKS